MGDRMTQDPVIRAVVQAVARYRPPTGVLYHPDGGSPYVAQGLSRPSCGRAYDDPQSLMNGSATTPQYRLRDETLDHVRDTEHLGATGWLRDFDALNGLRMIGARAQL